MRYGLIVEDPRAFSVADQQAILAAHGCDVVIQEPRLSAMVARRIFRLLGRLHAPDEIILASLTLLGRTTGELVELLDRLFASGVVVVIAPSPTQQLRLEPSPQTQELLAALVEHERGQAGAPRLSKRRRGEAGRDLELTASQVEHLRKLHAQGQSLRSIGLLFQLTPDEVLRIVTP